MTTDKSAPRKRRSPSRDDNPPTPRDMLVEIEAAHRAAEADTESGMRRTAAARAARKFKSEERRAEFLRGRGWNVVPPSGGWTEPSKREQASMAATLRKLGWTATPPAAGQFDGQADILGEVTLAPEQDAVEIVANLDPDEAEVATALGTPAEQAAADLTARIEARQRAAGK